MFKLIERFVVFVSEARAAGAIVGSISVASAIFIASFEFHGVGLLASAGLALVGALFVQGIYLAQLLTVNALSRLSRHRELSVVAAMAKRNAEECFLALTSLFFALGLCGLVAFLTRNFTWVPFIFSIVLALAMFSRYFLFQMRVRNGTYGTTEPDVREIISFVLDNGTATGPDGGRLREVLTAADLDAVREVLASGDNVQPA